MCSVSLNVECVTNPLFFDMKLKDERSSIADNGSGSPLICRVFLTIFVRLSADISRWRKYFFHSMATEAIERGDLVLESHVSSVLSKKNRHMANICHGKIKLQ